jgi:hypothetical protein
MSMTLEERVLAAYYDRLTAFAIDKSRVIASAGRRHGTRGNLGCDPIDALGEG